MSMGMHAKIALARARMRALNLYSKAFDDAQPRDDHGRWTAEEGAVLTAPDAPGEPRTVSELVQHVSYPDTTTLDGAVQHHRAEIKLTRVEGTKYEFYQEGTKKKTLRPVQLDQYHAHTTWYRNDVERNRIGTPNDTLEETTASFDKMIASEKKRGGSLGQRTVRRLPRAEWLNS